MPHAATLTSTSQNKDWDRVPLRDKPADAGWFVGAEAFIDQALVIAAPAAGRCDWIDVLFSPSDYKTAKPNTHIWANTQRPTSSAPDHS